MATLIKSNGQVKSIKNLGWLVRNSSRVKELEVSKLYNECREAKLIAHMNNGDKYEAEFSSWDVLWYWLTTRRSLYGLPIRAYGGGYDGGLMTVKKDMRW